MKNIYFKKIFFVWLFLNLGLFAASAQTKNINLLDKNGNVVESFTFTSSDSEARMANERMKFFWLCWSKEIFSGLTCNFADNAAKKQVTKNVFAQQVSTDLPAVKVELTSNTPTPIGQVVYQVLERAVPGPQGPAGPAGRPGVDAAVLNNNNINLATYSTSPTFSGQYNGFGIQSSSANPTGDASLSTISGSGLSTCNSTTSKILYNSSTKLFECGTDLNTGGGGFSGGDLSAQNIFATTSIQTPMVYASTTNSTTSNSITGNIINLVNTNATITNATLTQLFVSNASLTFATSTYIFANTILNTNLNSTNSTVTNSTSTSLFTSILNSLTSTIADLLFTNATGTNATTTNFFSTSITNLNFSSIGNFSLATGTISSTTLNNVNANNVFIHNLVGVLATFTSGTSTNWYTTNASTANLVSGNATFSYATVTNGFFTNLSVTGPVSAALNNGFIFRGGTNNFSEATSSIFVADSGKVGVGSTTPSEKLSVEGNLLVSGNIVSPRLSNLSDSVSGSDQFLCVTSTGQVVKDNLGTQLCFSSYSDFRLKQNIATVTDMLGKIRNLNTVNFNWIDEARGTSTQLGYIAQDVEKVFPEVIKKDENGFLKVNYLSLSAIYTNAIKELDLLVSENANKVLDILNRLTKNEEEILNLKTRVQNLENSLNISAPVVPIVPVQTISEPTSEVQIPENSTIGTQAIPETPTEPTAEQAN